MDLTGLSAAYDDVLRVLPQALRTEAGQRAAARLVIDNRNLVLLAETVRDQPGGLRGRFRKQEVTHDEQVAPMRVVRLVASAGGPAELLRLARFSVEQVLDLAEELTEAQLQTAVTTARGTVTLEAVLTQWMRERLPRLAGQLGG